MRTPDIRALTVTALAAGLLVVGAAAAQAQTHPPLRPTRDVKVTYQVTPGANAPAQVQGPRELQVLYSATGRMRVDSSSPGHPGFAILDRPAHSMIVVMPAEHRYLQMPLQSRAGDTLQLDNPDLTFVRGGSATVAGLNCTQWQVSSKSNPAHAGTACITKDGVMLKGSGNASAGSMLATKVEYGTLPDALFRPPPGFQKMEMPTGVPPRR